MVITVTCSSCSSSFPVDPAKIPEGGVNARCSSCGNVFRVEKPVEVEPLPTLEAVEPVAPPAAAAVAADYSVAETEDGVAETEDGVAAPEDGVATPEDSAAAPPSASGSSSGSMVADETVAEVADAVGDAPAVETEHVFTGDADDDPSVEGEEGGSAFEEGAGESAPTADVVADHTDVEGAEDDRAQVFAADTGQDDDWVVEHEEVPSMEPDPLPPIDDRLPEIPDQAGEEPVEPAERADPFEESMGLQVDSLEVEVEFQVDVEDRDSGAPDPWDDSTGADPAVVTEGESDSTTDMAPGYTTDVGSSEETAEWVSDEVDDAAAHQPVEDETDDAAAHQPVEDETDVAAAHQPVEDETDVAEEEPSAAVGSDTVDAPEAGGAEVEEPPEAVEESPTVQGFTFGKRDPTDKAKRLARVLVSDMIMYNAERHQSALAAGTLVQDFEEEIEKSWKEYVDQVGAEMADGEGRGYWTRALNDILAKGDEVF